MTKPDPRDLLWPVIILLYVVYRWIATSSSNHAAWRYALAVGLIVLGVSLIVGWVQNWRRYRQGQDGGTHPPDRREV